MNCRYCNRAGATVPTFSYWSKVADVCHAECKQAGERQEAIDCQVIDADCNDCKHYHRGKLAPKEVSRVKTTDGRWVDVIFNPEYYIGGRCLKFDREVIAQPNKWTGMECFEHRRL